MNLTDLTAELEARAEVVDEPAAVSRLIGVRHRIRVRRRRQVAAITGGTALLVTAVVLAPSLSGLQADRTPTPANVTEPSDPLVFASAVARDPLVAGAVGVAGQQDLVLRFTPKDAKLAITSFCRAPGVSDETSEDTGLNWATTVNGHRMTWGGCSADDGPNPGLATRGEPADAGLAGWADFGVLPGRESVFRIRMTADAGTKIPPGLRIGLGLYELTASRVQSDGVTFPEFLESDGHEYRLAGYRTAKATAKATAADHRLAIKVPAGRAPALVRYGSQQTEAESESDGTAHLTVDGTWSNTSADGGITVDARLDDSEAHTVAVLLDLELRGTMLIAYYVRED